MCHMGEKRILRGTSSAGAKRLTLEQYIGLSTTGARHLEDGDEIFQGAKRLWCL